ncbi:MAG: hypothetical protein JST80_01295 [Bdellovibrionales bacterium]|nr:hypothetical protein [Bdellovibrionales bacterium]
MSSVVINLLVLFLGVLGLGAGLQKLLKVERTQISSLILGPILVYLAWIITLNPHICFVLLQFAAIYGVWILCRLSGTLAFAILFVVLGSFFLASPIEGWDERFVWAYNAKALHAFHGAELFQHLRLPEAWIVHPENPKLYALLAAIVSEDRPWSAYFPKVPMILLWLPVCLTILRLDLERWQRALIALITLTCSGQYLFTTYLDPLLAMNVFIGAWVLFFDRPLKREGLLLLSMVPLLKMEGAIIVSLIYAAYLWLAWKENRIRGEIRDALWLVPAVLCFIGWKYRCFEWGLASYYTTHSQESFITRFLARALAPGQYWVVLRSMIQANRILFDLILIAGVYRWVQTGFGSRALKALLGAMFAYLASLFVIYFGTPLDMTWHIATSIDRTTLPFYILTFGLLVVGPSRAQSSQQE